MKLTYEQIQSVTKGAHHLTEEKNGIRFSRFTEAQEELYRNTKDDFYKKTFATAGVRLEFVTDSRTLSIEVEMRAGSSRKYFSHDVVVNGKLVASFGSNDTTSGIFAASFDLGEGEKEVRVYFPWSAGSLLRRMELDDGATLTPVAKQRKMLIYGDSITHGYDAAHPSRSYASLLTDALDAEAFNKGIGGEKFFPALASLSDEIEPDLITVAYGTNDWSGLAREEFEQRASDFYRILSERNPRARIFAITPIWRADEHKPTQVGAFSYVKEFLTRTTADLPNVTVLDGYDYVPKEPKYFADLHLHPNDEGFDFYANALLRAIQQHL